MMKKLTATLLAFLISFSFASCSKDAPEPTTEPKTEEKKQETVTEEVDPFNALRDTVNTWIGYGEKGTLTKPGQQKVYAIQTKEDLDPFRQYLRITEDEEATLFQEKRDRTVLIEMVSVSENAAYDIINMYQSDNTICIEISETELEEITPAHTFMLFHAPYSEFGDVDVSVEVLTDL